MSAITHNVQMDNTCRTCLLEKENMKSLFETDANCCESLQLFEMLMAFTSVQVQEDDGLPGQICLACIDCITRSFSFKRLCESSDSTLREVLRKTRKNDEHFNKLKPQSDFALPFQQSFTDTADRLDIKMELEEDKITFGDLISDTEYKETDDLNLETIEFAYNEDRKPTHDSELLKTNALVNENHESICPMPDDGEQPIYACKECSACFQLENDLKMHSRSHDKLTRHECKVCNREFVGLRRLTNHMTAHDATRPHLCSVCGKGFKLPYDLRKHLRTHTGEKPYACKLCAKAFSQSGALVEHMRAHTNEKKFSCATCEMSFSRLTGLYAHKKTHTGIKRHACTVCGKKFFYPKPLAIHMKTHKRVKVKVHVCPYCEKGFSTSYYLEIHKRMHTGEKRYVCKVCGRGYAIASDLKKHKLSHTDAQLYKCSLCGTTFGCGEELRVHINGHTDKQNPSEIRQKPDGTSANLLPDKSRPLYERKFQKFEHWCKEKKIDAITENVLLDYFQLQKDQYKASTVWATYSMIRSCLNIYRNIDISKYSKLQAFLKRASEGYAPKKSEILEEEHIQQFIEAADDDIYLAMKVMLIMGFNGACRREEITYMSVDDIQYAVDSIVVTVPRRKNNKARTFTIAHAQWIAIVKKYARLRPETATNKRFFLTYRNGHCVNLPIGINIVGTIPRKVATFLNLPRAELFTGNCFRRSSAAHRANRAGELIRVKRDAMWKSSDMAEVYIDASLTPKIEVYEDTFESSECTNFNVPTCSSASQMQFNDNS